MTSPPQTPATPQRISRLAPLPDVQAAVDRLALPVAARALDLVVAAGRVLAADLVVAAPQPVAAVAVRDGWAVRADLVADAGPYAPIPVFPLWVDAGDPLPDDTDAVLPPDAVVTTRSAQEAIAPAFPGEGALAVLDGGHGTALRRAGEFLRAIDIAALRAAGVARVGVREPMVTIVSTNRQVSAAADAVAPLIAAALEAAGGRAHVMRASVAAGALESALLDGGADAVVTIGGTGQGRGDRAIAVASAHGEIAMHGMGIKPGDTAALASVGARPVLMLPGRLDAALAVWLLVGRRLLGCLTGDKGEEVPLTATLSRKIASTIGLAEVVLVRRRGERAEPMDSAALAVPAMAQADGWVLVAPESEGYPAGASVVVRALP